MTDQPETGDSGGAYQSFLSLGPLEPARHPRPLTQEERAVLDAVMDPVLADLRTAGAIVPEVRYQAWQDRGPGYVDAIIAPPGRSPAEPPAGSSGVWVARFGPAGERLANLAEQVQEWEVEALAEAFRPATWPECPDHPASHPLEPAVEAGDRAVWRCPRSQRAVAAIGELPGRR